MLGEATSVLGEERVKYASFIECVIIF